jgi:hypothetical protein
MKVSTYPVEPEGPLTVKLSSRLAELNVKLVTDEFECGAKYIVIFDYYPNNQTVYGTMTPQDFQAMRTFWNRAVNHSITQGSIKADSVLVLPANYGWGADGQQTIYGESSNRITQR